MSANSKDKGAILITTLLIMSVMATLSLTMMDSILIAVKRTANIQSHAQARWYVKGADDYAQLFLSELNLGNEANASETNAQLLEGIENILPIDNGLIAFAIRDGSACLSTSILIDNPDGVSRFEELFEALGFDTLKSQEWAALLADWADPDDRIGAGQENSNYGGEDFLYLGRNRPHRTAGTEFSSVFELRALDIFTPEEFNLIRPFICTRPSPDRSNQINMNILTPEHAPLLAALLGDGQNISLAEDILATRPQGGWSNVAAFRSLPAVSSLTDANIAYDLMSFAPQTIWMDVQVDYLEVSRRAGFEYSVENNQIRQTYRYFGPDAHWPRPVTLLEQP